MQTYIGRPDTGYNNPKAIAVDDSGNVYVTGTSEGIGTMYDYATIKYTQTIGVEELGQKGKAFTFSVLQNPVIQKLDVRLTCPEDEKVTISLYDISGRLVTTLFTGKAEERLSFSIKDIPSGVYFLSVHTNKERKVKKVVILK